ncbi:unnamed protein product [Rhizophagus irregularis]|nr:unnamed protein product [Rhizophagus irregularis]
MALIFHSKLLKNLSKILNDADDFDVYIYTGELGLTKYQGKNIFELIIAYDELLLEELLNYVYLIENQTNWIQENYVLVLHKVFQLTSCEKLRDYCCESISEDPNPLISSKNLPSLDKGYHFCFT